MTPFDILNGLNLIVFRLDGGIPCGYSTVHGDGIVAVHHISSDPHCW